ncbi:DHH family phosphoesterase [Candidatus Mycoplasma mahonii]|uniref:DHH family phosphoesterase n=1 Tax=Candidatus Mycoplasma mahonii TaxID=3004105 RepID=UPI0026EEA4F8|nr:DHH family phosphoesterase [Candidatus Mycoplasma mahonii]WKX02459.1 DHH family phosphoesterase [Candidatus Mycoplasma mahonii]
MNKMYEKIWNEIKTNKNITILSHIDADGDTTGSATALKHLILDNTNVQEVKISGEKAPRFISFLDESEEVSDKFFNSSQVIVVDTSTISRIHDQRVNTINSIKIDHHHHENKWKLEIGGDKWPATGQILYEMAKQLDLTIPKRAAEAMWVAIWTDTEEMTQRSLSTNTWEAIEHLVQNKKDVIKKLALTTDENNSINNLRKELVVQNDICALLTETIVPNDYLRQMTALFSNEKGFEIYLGVTKVSSNIYRGELRSKGNIDVSLFAKHMGGGGHYSSSGFMCKSLKEAREFLEYIKSNR